MIAVMLDPTVLVFPDESPAELSSRLATLRLWGSFANHRWLHLALPRRSKNAIIECGLYPAFNAIKASLGKAGLSTVFSTNDISAQVSRLFDCTESEALTVVEDVLWAGEECQPAFHYSTTEERLRTEVLRILVLLATTQKLQGIITRVAGLASPQACAKIAVTCLVELIIPEELAGSIPEGLPTPVGAEISIIRSIEELCDVVEPEKVWKIAEGNEDLRLGISLRCRQRMREAGSYADWSSLPRFRVGEHFLSSLKPCRAHCDGTHARVVLDKSAMAVVRTANLEVKPFVDGEGNQIIRVTDSAKAFRIHVTKDHEALRLMFWERPDGSIELANVGAKAELRILEGDPGKAV
jgi:hypothetical protein